MKIQVQFHSYFKDLTECPAVEEEAEPGTSLGQLYDRLITRFPKLARMEKSTLMAVGVEYQNRDYVLQDGDQVSLFPPVQGG